MTAQYTATQQLLPSNVMADTLPSKTNVNAKTNGQAFETALDKASKPYTDKSEIKQDSVQNTKEYEHKTKEITKHESKETNTDTKKEQNGKVCADSEQKQINKTEEKNNVTESDIVTDESITTENTDKNPEAKIELEQPKVEELNLIQNNKSVEELIEEIKINATTITETVQTAVKNVTEISDNIQKSNKIATEQLIANVEFENVDTKNINIDAIKNIDTETLQKLVEQAKPEIDTNVKELNTQNQPTIIKSNTELASKDLNLNTLQVSNNINETEVLNTESATKTAPVEKTAKEMLATDTSKLTVNLDESLDINPEKIQENKDIKIVAPTDTVEENTPKIKVTEEVVSQIKDNFTTSIENKDNTSKIKDKAISTMTTLQDKETLVTESNINNQNSNNSNLQQNNAGETAIKLAVETNSFNTQTQTTETFINKLDAQLTAKETTILNKSLDQENLLSQVTSKFEQLQQQSGSKVSIVLQPESLGRVSVEIMNTKDGIVAKMTTDTQQVKELFDKSIESLKSNLSAQGVNVNNIKVECTHESTNNAMNFERDQFNQAFNNNQNNHNNTNKSEQNLTNSYSSDNGTTADEQQEEQESTRLKNTETIIKHNGKVDYSV